MRILFFLIFGLCGAAILLALGNWQVQRLDWKRGILGEIDARIAEAPVALPVDPDYAADQYLAVTAAGRILPGGHRVLVSAKRLGPGHRIISPFEVSDGRRILLDRGFVSVDTTADIAVPEQGVTVTGNLLWPDEIDRFTPPPEIDDGLWFARDVPALAAVLDTEPVMLVAARIDPADPVVAPMPVDSSAIPNDHLQYAITWFSLAAIWLAMSAYFLRRPTRRPQTDTS